MQKIVKPSAKKPYKPKTRTRLPNGFGSVTTLSGNRRRPFAARKTIGWNEKGQPIQKTIGYFETWMAAFEALSDYNRNPYDLESACATFKDIYDQWSRRKFTEVRNGKTISNQSVVSYTAAYKHFERIHNRVFRDLTTMELQSVVDSCSRGRATQENMLTLLNQLYKYAMEFDITDKNMTQFIKISKSDTRSSKRPFTTEEIARVWNHQGDPATDMILILLYTGMRIRELLEMKKANVHLDEHYMQGGLKTVAGINRIIPIHDKILPVMERVLSYYDSDSIFPESYRAFISKLFTKFCQDLQLDHKTHECRHTFISRADDLGLNDTAVKMIVGHARSGVTQSVYTHKSIDQLVAEVNKLYY